MTWVIIVLGSLTILFCIGVFISISQLKKAELREPTKRHDFRYENNKYFDQLFKNIPLIIVVALVVAAFTYNVVTSLYIDKIKEFKTTYAALEGKQNIEKRIFKKPASTVITLNHTFYLKSKYQSEKNNYLIKRLKSELAYNNQLLATNKKLKYSVDSLFAAIKISNNLVDTTGKKTVESHLHDGDNKFNDQIIVHQYVSPNGVNDAFDDGITIHQGVSPNGDGINDILVIDGLTSYPNNKLQIVNRDGAIVYEAEGYDNSSKTFDGHSSITGKKLKAGTYFYSLDYKDGNEIKHKTGFILLKY